jgi:heme a synthase
MSQLYWPTKQLRLLALVTLVLIGLGSYVRATGAGLACPDWPLCFGLAIPKFTYGVTQEVVHRYLAACVMLFTLWILVRGYQLRHTGRQLLLFGSGLMVLVIIQALFGGLTVTMKLNPLIVTTHLALGTIFFQLVAVGSFPKLRKSVSVPASLNALLMVLAILTFLQIVVGGYVGASGAALVCPGFPSCGVESKLTGAQHLQLTHRVLGFMLLGVLALTSLKSATLVGQERKAIHNGVLRTAALVGLQIVVGWLNVIYLVPWLITVIHVVLAQGILLHVLLLSWRAKPSPITVKEQRQPAQEPISA